MEQKQQQQKSMGNLYHKSLSLAATAIPSEGYNKFPFSFLIENLKMVFVFMLMALFFCPPFSSLSSITNHRSWEYVILSQKHPISKTVFLFMLFFFSFSLSLFSFLYIFFLRFYLKSDFSCLRWFGCCCYSSEWFYKVVTQCHQAFASSVSYTMGVYDICIPIIVLRNSVSFCVCVCASEWVSVCHSCGIWVCALHFVDIFESYKFRPVTRAQAEKEWEREWEWERTSE